MEEKTKLVQLVNPLNKNIVLEQAEFPLTKGCLPMRQICEKWRIRNPYWIDVNNCIFLLKCFFKK